MPQPTDVPWPDGKPVWAGADGSGDQTGKTFTMPGTNLVIAECGNAVTGLVQVISNYTIIPSSRFICLSNTVTVEAWTVDENGVAVKTNSDWTIPEGAERVAFVDGVIHTNAMTNVSVVTIIGTNVSVALDDIQIHAHATSAKSLADDEWFTVIKVELNIWNGGADLDNGQNPGPQGDQVPDADKETVGAYLLVNWDDDDGDGVMNADGSWSNLPIPDLAEDYVVNEDNLPSCNPQLNRYWIPEQSSCRCPAQTQTRSNSGRRAAREQRLR